MKDEWVDDSKEEMKNERIDDNKQALKEEWWAAHEEEMRAEGQPTVVQASEPKPWVLE